MDRKKPPFLRLAGWLTDWMVVYARYTSNVMAPGILFGSEERYEGFGLLFDSYDDDGKNDNPIIMGWINDGTKVLPTPTPTALPTAL